MKNFRIFESSRVRVIKCSNVFVLLFLKAYTLLLLVFSSHRVLIILFEAVCTIERSEKNSLKRLSAAEAAARILDMDFESDSESDDNTSQDSERYASKYILIITVMLNFFLKIYSFLDTFIVN